MWKIESWSVKKKSTPAGVAAAQTLSKMAEIVTAINNTVVKTVRSQAFSIRRTAIQKRKKNTFWQPIGKDPVCVGSQDYMGYPETLWFAGSKKVKCNLI